MAVVGCRNCPLPQYLRSKIKKADFNLPFLFMRAARYFELGSLNPNSFNILLVSFSRNSGVL